jgi:hypothetical protein
MRFRQNPIFPSSAPDGAPERRSEKCAVGKLAVKNRKA